MSPEASFLLRLRTFAERNFCAPTAAEYLADCRAAGEAPLELAAVYERFGSWADALWAAGVSPVAIYRMVKRDQLLVPPDVLEVPEFLKERRAGKTKWQVSYRVEVSEPEERQRFNPAHVAAYARMLLARLVDRPDRL